MHADVDAVPQVGPHEGRVEGDKWLHKISILMMHYKERNINSE